MAVGVLKALFAGALSPDPTPPGEEALTMRRALLIVAIAAVAALGGRMGGKRGRALRPALPRS